MVKVATTKAQRKLFFNLRSMKQGLKSDAAMAEDGAMLRDTLTSGEIDAVAEKLNVKREEVMEMEAMGPKACSPSSLGEGSSSTSPPARRVSISWPTAHMSPRP